MNNKNDLSFPSMLDIITELEKETLAFYECINSESNSVFVDNKEFSKKYKSTYSAFSLTLANYISKCEMHVLKLTELINKADKECDAEETVKLCAEFDNYVKFCEGVSDFIKQNETIIKENINLNKKNTVIPAQNLLSTIQNYIKELQPND
jgi:hypothetical protein